MRPKFVSQPKRAPPKVNISTPTMNNKPILNYFKNKDCQIDVDKYQTIANYIKQILFKQLSIKNEINVSFQKLFQYFQEKPINLNKILEQCIYQYKFQNRNQEFINWKIQNPKFISQLSNKLISSKQFKQIIKKLDQYQVLQENEIQCQNLPSQIKIQNILQEYKRLSLYQFADTLQRRVQGMILFNQVKLYKTIKYKESSFLIESQIFKCVQKIIERDQLNNEKTRIISQKLYLQNRSSSKIQKYLWNINDILKQIEILQKSEQKQIIMNQLKKRYSQLIDQWLFVKNSLNNFDLGLFLRLIDKNEQYNDVIKGKNVILLVGSSGVGKTTIMLKMLGYQLRMIKFKNSNQKSLISRTKLKPQHKRLISKPGAASITKSIFSVPLNIKYSDLISNLYICDTPGFFDSSGPLIDIVNSITMTNSIKKAKSIKIAVVITPSMIDQRFQGLKKLAGMVSNLLIKNTKTISFIFNKFSKEQFDSLPNKILNLINGYKNDKKIDNKYIGFLCELYKSVSNNPSEQRIFFDPFNFDINTAALILSRNHVENPSEMFQYSQSLQSKQVLQAFIIEKINLINFYLQKDPNVSCFHFLELKIFISKINNIDLQQEYIDIKRNIEENNRQHFNQLKELLSDQVWRDFIADNLIERSRQIYDKLKSNQIFQKRGECYLFSTKQIESLFEPIFSLFQDLFKKIEKKESLMENEKYILRKMPLFCSKFDRIEYFQQFKARINYIFEKNNKKMKKILQYNNFLDYKQIYRDNLEIYKITMLFQSSDNQRFYSGKVCFLERYNQKKQILFKELNRIKKDLQTLSLSSYQMQINNDNLQMEKIQQILHGQLLQTKDQRTNIIQLIKGIIKKLVNQFELMIEIRTQQVLVKLNKILQNLHAIISLKIIEYHVRTSHQYLLQLLKKAILKNEKRLQQILKALKKGEINPKFVFLKIILYTLNQFPKLSDYKAEQIQQIQELQYQLIDLMQNKGKKLTRIYFSLQNNKQTINISLLLTKLKRLQYIQNVHIQQLQSQRYEDFNKCLNQLKTETIQQGMLPIKQLIKVLQFNSNHHVQKGIHKVLKNYRVYRNYMQQLEKQFIIKHYNSLNIEPLSLMKTYLNSFFKQLILNINQIQDRTIFTLTQKQADKYYQYLQNLSILNRQNGQDSIFQQKNFDQRYGIYQLYERYCCIIQRSVQYFLNKETNQQNLQENILIYGQSLKKYKQFINQQQYKNIENKIEQYQSLQQKTAKEQLQHLFSRKLLSFQKFDQFYTKYRYDHIYIEQLTNNMKKYDEKLQQLIKQLHIQIFTIQDNKIDDKQLEILEYGILFLQKIKQRKGIFTQKIDWKVDRNLINKKNQKIKKHINSIFNQIRDELLKIDFEQLKLKEHINYFSRLQNCLSQRQRQNIRDSIEHYNMGKYLLNFPQITYQSLHNYLESLYRQIIERRNQNIKELIDPQNIQSLQVYENLSQHHKQQYMQYLTSNYKVKKEQLQSKTCSIEFQQSKRKAEQIISLMPVCFRQKYYQELEKIIQRREQMIASQNRNFNNALLNHNLKEMFKIIDKNKQHISDQWIKSVKQQIQSQSDYVIDKNVYQSNSQRIRCIINSFNYMQAIRRQSQNAKNIKQISFSFQVRQIVKLSVILKRLQQLLLMLKQLHPLKISTIEESQILKEDLMFLFDGYHITKDNHNILYYQNLSQRISQCCLSIEDYFIMLAKEYSQNPLYQQLQQLDKQSLEMKIRTKYLLNKIIYDLIEYSNDYRFRYQLLDKNRFSKNCYENFNTVILKKQQEIKKMVINRLEIIKSNVQVQISPSQIFQMKKQFTALITIENIYKKLVCQNIIQKKHALNGFIKCFINHFIIQLYQLSVQQLQLQQFLQDGCHYNKTSFLLKFLESDNSINLKIELIEDYPQKIQNQLVKCINTLKQKGNLYLKKMGKQSLFQSKYKNLRNYETSQQKFLNIMIILSTINDKFYKHLKQTKKILQQLIHRLADLPQSSRQIIRQLLKNKFKNNSVISYLSMKYNQLKLVNNDLQTNNKPIQRQNYIKIFKSRNTLQTNDLLKKVNRFYNDLTQIIQSHRQYPLNTKKKVKAQIIENIHLQSAEFILPKIYALYSIIKKQSSIDDKYFHPYTPQIIASILLIDTNEEGTQLASKLIEIPPGQGKSIVLGIVACYLACRGFKVFYSSYSDMLITRDKNEFNQLLTYIGIINNIKYGNFSQICQQMLDKTQKNKIAQNFKSTWLGDKYKKLINKISKLSRGLLKYIPLFFQQDIKQQKILLLDEVDILFSQNYQYKIYKPNLELTDSFIQNNFISNLYLQIYDKIKANRNYNQQFQNALKIKNIYPRIGVILLNAVEQIKNIVRMQYKLIQKIKTNHAFKRRVCQCQFATFEQNIAGIYLMRNNQIKQQKLKHSLKIFIRLCQISYSQLPFFFQVIIGVSGALSTIPDIKRQKITDKYKIRNIYRLPSIFRIKNSLSFKIQKQKSQYKQNLIRIIDTHFLSFNQAVIVLCKDKYQVDNFRSNSQFSKLQRRSISIQQLIYDSNLYDYNEHSMTILKATQHLTVTFATEQFSRGVDFRDKNEASKGIFLILTYIPVSFQEYLQAKGRIARCGKPGKCLIYLLNEKFQIPHFQNQDDFRQYFFDIKENQFHTLNHKLKSIQLKDKQSIRKYASEQIDILSYLQRINYYRPPSIIRIIIGIEESLSGKIQIIRKVVQIMKTYEAIYQQKASFRLQFSVFIYGNYLDFMDQFAKNMNARLFVANEDHAIYIDQIVKFVQQNDKKKGANQGKKESVQLFFRHIINRQQQNEQNHSIFLFCSKQNMSWIKQKQKAQSYYGILNKDAEYIEKYLQYKQLERNMEYLPKNVNIFCFQNNQKVNDYFQNLRKRFQFISRIEYLMKEQLTDKFRNICELQFIKIFNNYLDETTR